MQKGQLPVPWLLGSHVYRASLDPGPAFPVTWPAWLCPCPEGLWDKLIGTCRGSGTRAVTHWNVLVLHEFYCLKNIYVRPAWGTEAAGAKFMNQINSYLLTELYTLSPKDTVASNFISKHCTFAHQVLCEMARRFTGSKYCLCADTVIASGPEFWHQAGGIVCLSITFRCLVIAKKPGNTSIRKAE